VTTKTKEEFNKRILKQTKAQLAEYWRSNRHLDGYRGSPTTLQHADWTALAFGGLPYAEIARWDLDTAPYGAPEDAVRMAVNRYAMEIGLTLPERSKGM
jgi:hypothetical protein